jgi:energy-coupling factor transporter ATP-binding protein EcfA2
MQLESMWVHGIRRFGGETPTRLRLDAPLICLIGANEVGKSTLLDALELVQQESDQETEVMPAVPASDWTRGENLPGDRAIVRLRYRLNASDLKVLSELETADRLGDVRWLEQTKLVDGSLVTEVIPQPTRDKARRHKLGELIEKARDAEDNFLAQVHEDTPAAPTALDQIVEDLGSSHYYINRDRLIELADFLEAEDQSPGIMEKLRKVAELENIDHPRDEAREALQPLIPRFVRFEPEVRELANEYDLAALAMDPPPALRNLAELAGLDLELLLQEIQNDLTGNVEELVESAKQDLERQFSAWTQEPPVAVTVDTSGTRLLVHVKSGSGKPMKIGERSDGLRQFVALVALTAGEGHVVPPILLIDEAERHLHYDAQADLMGVLARQTAASQVIYTTHSAACLPEDLGACVRVVHGIGDQMLSTVEQQFWSDDPGMVPLLLAMGAGSLAFVPLRPAAIVEGPSDLILLPSLMLEAVGGSELGLQVVPGAAGVPPERVAGLDLQGVKTVWILDGDKAGIERQRFLRKQNIPGARIHLLKSGSNGLDLEDLIHRSTYVEAVNAYAHDLGSESTFVSKLLPRESCRRHKAVEKWCKKQGVKPPGKAAIANKVLELRGDRPLLEPTKRSTLRSLHKRISKQLEEPLPVDEMDPAG